METKVSNIRPLSDYLLVEPETQEKTLPSGIVLPDTADKEKPQSGKVVAVGPGRLNKEGERVTMEIKKDDLVMYKKWGGTEVKVEGKEYLLVKEEDILAIIINK